MNSTLPSTATCTHFLIALLVVCSAVGWRESSWAQTPTQLADVEEQCLPIGACMEALSPLEFNSIVPASWTSCDGTSLSAPLSTSGYYVDTEVLPMQALDENASTDYQDAPGNEPYDAPYYRSNAELPGYYYNPSYYSTPYVGARPLADYAPPGYEPRDHQSAPGEPEFERIVPPVAPPPGEPENIVTRGMYPGSFLVPGTNTSFRLRGFVRLATLYDFDPIGSPDSFVTNSIPVPQQTGQNANFSARMSRFALESWTPTKFCDWNVHTFIEGDFFNGPGQAAGGGGNPWRLRHAFIDFGYFRFGQQNSVFMDGASWPSVVDFQGPNSWINQRQPSARMTVPVTSRVYWATSMERCFSDVTTNGLGTAVQDVPDFATHLRLEGNLGHLQAGTVLRTIGYRPTDDDLTRKLGVGLSGSAVFHPWAVLLDTDPVHDTHPSGLTRSRILMQCSGGPGVGRYINDLSGQGLDAQVDPITGAFDLVEATGWNASYEHWFNEHWLSNFTYSYVSVDNVANQPVATYEQARYLAANLWWIPVPGFSFGVEYLHGERRNVDGQQAEAQRLHGLVQYNF